jgi:hypothetical protein
MKKPIDRFNKKYKKINDCWIWQNGKNNQGYGMFYFEHKMVLAHRWMYEFTKGDIPEKLGLDHLCRTPLCVNPNHLEPVTQWVNQQRGLINQYKNRNCCSKGHKYKNGTYRIYKATTRTRFRNERICKICEDGRRNKFKLKKLSIKDNSND